VSQLRRLIAVGLIFGGACFGSADHVTGSAHAQGTKPAAPFPSEVQVDLLRDWPTFSRAAWTRLPTSSIARANSAQVYSNHGWQTVAQRIAYKYSRGHKDIVVVIGHSLGFNATFDVSPTRSTGRTFPSS
jgi:hypothetical protein